MSDYFEKRRHLTYYKYTRTLLGLLSYNAKSICDVGSNGVDLISWLPCPEKVSIDLRNPFSGNGVEGIQADFIKYDFARKFETVSCFQVMEHIKSKKIRAFAKKLLTITEKLLIVSVPYMWPKGFCRWHAQDPVDEKKFFSWFDKIPDSPLKPVFSRVITDKSLQTGKPIRYLVVVFAAKELAEALDLFNDTDTWLIRYK